MTAHEVSPGDTVRMLRERMGLCNVRFFRGRQALGMDKSFDELGVTVGAMLTCLAVPFRSAEQQAKCRLRAGVVHTSTRHPHLHQIETVVETDGLKTRKALEPIVDGVEACNKKLDDID